jgi:hypothetical protein
VPKRTLTLEDDATYEVNLVVQTEFVTAPGTQSQLWTGFALPVSSFDPVMPPEVVALFGWNAPGQRFDFWFRGFPLSFQTLLALETGRPYFFQATGSAQVVIPGGESLVLGAGGDVPLTTGVTDLLWNGSVVELPQIGDVLPVEISAAFSWNNDSQRFDFWFRGFPVQFQVLTRLQPWQSYFVQSVSPTTLHVPFGPSQPSSD